VHTCSLALSLSHDCSLPILLSFYVSLCLALSLSLSLCLSLFRSVSTVSLYDYLALSRLLSLSLSCSLSFLLCLSVSHSLSVSIWRVMNIRMGTLHTATHCNTLQRTATHTRLTSISLWIFFCFAVKQV